MLLSELGQAAADVLLKTPADASLASAVTSSAAGGAAGGGGERGALAAVAEAAMAELESGGRAVAQ
jgi:hypothetical protein